ncbi:hypothetical protein SDC9_106710 [bioreactor metagenome]|uniref:Uncharacterized protein n=1 Tax=bioreactor metagenome TaxID=1076179 RepID=A0A645BDS7_9ZZZZ
MGRAVLTPGTRPVPETLAGRLILLMDRVVWLSMQPGFYSQFAQRPEKSGHFLFLMFCESICASNRASAQTDSHSPRKLICMLYLV